ncbi:signal peptidase II [Candidatus Falkowbacteria bacterium]|nr:signal peptidase II [Candidatus Falkowbacteria bacterium]
MNKKTIKTLLVNIAITFGLAIFFLADRILKAKALNLEAPIELIPNLLLFNLTKNYFISFSLPLSGPILNIFIVLLIIILAIYLIFLIIKEKDRKLEIILLLFIFFGALSNLIDRLSLGFVVDYLELRYFTVFNLADVMIVIPSFWLILNNLKIKK